MRVLIVGAGVNGTLAAAALAEAGADATVVTRPERQRQLLMAQTKITSPLGRFSKPLHAVTPTDLSGPFDVVILAVRANVFQPSLFAVRDAITASTLLVPLFDGVGHIGHWQERYPDNPVALARFNVRATQDADGVVRQLAPLGDLQMGLMTQHGAEKLEALCRALDGRRFCAYPEAETLRASIWAHAVYRAACAGACQLTGKTLRDTLRFGSRRPFEIMLREGVLVGEARGIWKSFHIAERYRTAFLRESEPVSVPAPIAAGGRAGSEALYLLATMVRIARDAKVATPNLVRAWEATSPAAPALEETA